MNATSNWVLFALGFDFFPALTAIFGKLGVSKLSSNVATLICTVVILVVTVGIISRKVLGNWSSRRFSDGTSLQCSYIDMVMQLHYHAGIHLFDWRTPCPCPLPSKSNPH